MALGVSFQTRTEQFSTYKGGPRKATLDFHFDYPVYEAEAAVRGFRAEFTGSDHSVHLLYHRITNVRISPHSPRVVEVDVEFGLRDHSGDWDDNYEGELDVLVIALTYIKP
ncbi:hypothetical protein GCM10012275_23150 [Longimycelium tulufanense]|uniref:Uncharacterized protein n=1 Tax=Longimycelium tulufanense TaxID=907463 RepID=A0A8J3C7W2_9PSEU|nr:hypothetical protein [Longimycelium tulufanense]GGM51648.1 hypothetical protein GCM10012275_23150 [Longimycelium tulufanense]